MNHCPWSILAFLRNFIFFKTVVVIYNNSHVCVPFSPHHHQH
jgi:hypothetical protein